MLEWLDSQGRTSTRMVCIFGMDLQCVEEDKYILLYDFWPHILHLLHIARIDMGLGILLVFFRDKLESMDIHRLVCIQLNIEDQKIRKLEWCEKN